MRMERASGEAVRTELGGLYVRGLGRRRWSESSCRRRKSTGTKRSCWCSRMDGKSQKKRLLNLSSGHQALVSFEKVVERQ